MDPAERAPLLGVAASIAVLLALAAPFVLLTDTTGLGAYYAAGPVGVAAPVFLALLEVVVLLSGTRGQADPSTAAGVAFVVGLAMVALTALWAVTMDPNLVYSFAAADAWIEFHRFGVLALTLVVGGSAAAYSRAVV